MSKTTCDWSALCKHRLQRITTVYVLRGVAIIQADAVSYQSKSSCFACCMLGTNIVFSSRIRALLLYYNSITSSV